LNRHYEKERDYSSLKELLRKRADTSSGAEAAALHLRVAQLCQTQLGDASQARTHFELALQHDPTSQDAWLGLERVLVEQKQIQPLLELLTRRLSVAETPRERVDLLLRCAKLYEEELLQPQRAAESLSQVLVIDPLHAHAKEALIVNHLRTAEQRRAAGEIEQAAELFRQVLDLDAENLAALKGLSSIELKRGTWDGAVALLEKQVALTPDDETKASLLVEIGALKYQQLHDLVGARSATERALQIKPTLVGALTQAGDIAYDQDRLRDATQHYQQAIAQLHNLPTEVATRVLRRQVDSLDRLGSPSTAVDLLDPLLELAPDDPAVLSIAARLLFAHGTPAKAVDVHERLLREHRDAVPSDELALLTLHLGQSHQRTGNPSAALVHLEEAADLSPSTKEPIEALVLAYSELDDWNGVLKCKQRLLDLSDGAARAELLAEMAIITSDKLSDKPTAIRSLVAALEDKPDDRKLLTRLMALYSDGKDWSKLVEVISRLEALAENPEQKTKYLMTSAMVCQRELSDNERALAFYDRVLTLDPNHTKAADESLSLARALGKLDTVERLLSERLQRAQQTNSHGDLLAVFLQLGSLYKDDLHRSEAAVDAFEAAQTLDPQNDACLKALDELYGVDLDRYRDKAILLHTSQLHHNPFTPEPYQQLRRLYTGLRRADPAWCLCRTLNALSLSSPEEDQFYDRLRSEEAVAMENPLAPEDWQLLMHADADPLVTAIFSVIEPVVLATRATPITSLGYDPEAALDPAASEDPALQVLPYVAGALDSALPQIFANPSLAEPMTLLATDPPAVVLGAPFLEPSAPTQSLVFMAGQTLCGLLPGLRLRQFLSSGTGFKSWLLAAIRLNAPTFAIPTELVGPVGEAHAALRELLPPQARDELAHLIAKLLSDPGALDVKKWQIAVDCSADRAGFLLANDLRTAIDAIRGPTTELTSAQAARIKELVLFSVDEHYFTLRERLGVAIG
jgi:tetratricopeptide (TPR) repeat protein